MKKNLIANQKSFDGCTGKQNFIKIYEIEILKAIREFSEAKAFKTIGDMKMETSDTSEIQQLGINFLKEHWTELDFVYQDIARGLIVEYDK